MKTIIAIAVMLAFACQAADKPSTNALKATITVYQSGPNGVLCRGYHTFKKMYTEQVLRKSPTYPWLPVRTTIMREGIFTEPLGVDKDSLVYVEGKSNRPILDGEVLRDITIYRNGAISLTNFVLGFGISAQTIARYTTKP